MGEVTWVVTRWVTRLVLRQFCFDGLFPSSCMRKTTHQNEFDGVLERADKTVLITLFQVHQFRTCDGLGRKRPDQEDESILFLHHEDLLATPLKALQFLLSKLCLTVRDDLNRES